jgi:hypothetical protein
LEWAVVALPATPSVCAAPVAVPPTPLEGCAIAVNCTNTTYVDAGATAGVSPVIFQITVTASKGAVGSIGYIDRSVSASVEQ